MGGPPTAHGVHHFRAARHRSNTRYDVGGTPRVVDNIVSQFTHFGQIRLGPGGHIFPKGDQQLSTDGCAREASLARSEHPIN
jgi:hypothetical protein